MGVNWASDQIRALRPGAIVYSAIRDAEAGLIRYSGEKAAAAVVVAVLWRIAIIDARRCSRDRMLLYRRKALRRNRRPQIAWQQAARRYRPSRLVASTDYSTGCANIRRVAHVLIAIAFIKQIGSLP